MVKSEFKYFQERTDERLQSIEDKVDRLLEFKNQSHGKVVGASIVISAVVSIVVGLASIYFGVH